jgi:arabinose-5-phosphate isomerase
MAKSKKKNASPTTIQQAAEVLQMEADGILNLVDRLDDRFASAVEAIYRSRGRVIVAGIGKSGIIARKIVATLNSTGTRSLFLHPVEAVHGDLGIVSGDDIFLALSNSGETDELNILLASIRKIGCTVIAFTGNPDSTLARNSDIVIDAGVDREACPLGLAPTCSTTALLALGDALAVVLIHKHKFKESDFQRVHPGGALGQHLSSHVRELMFSGEDVPKVAPDVSMAEVVAEIDRVGIGAALVIREDKTLAGIITDGDIRRAIARGEPVYDLTAESIMSSDPHTVRPESPTYDALNMMEKHQITVLPIADSTGRIRGVLHLHDILGKGQFKFNGR